MPDGGDAEAALTADYNAEMIEQRARFRRLRDRSVFVGNPDDVVDATFGPGPAARSATWTEENFDFAGYVTGFDPTPLGGRAALRPALGYRAGRAGLRGHRRRVRRRRAAAAPGPRRGARWPGAGCRELRFVVVDRPADRPRVAAASGPASTVRGYLPDLVEHLAACDVAVVQGGLTTCMELTASRRPFVYVPLRHHFEQNFHVRHRLDRYGAGTCLEYDAASDPDALAEAVVAELDRDVDYRPVETDGAARAAALIGIAPSRFVPNVVTVSREARPMDSGSKPHEPDSADRQLQ